MSDIFGLDPTPPSGDTLKDGRKRPPFILVEVEMLGTINPNALAVFCAILKHANNDTRVAWPSHKRIATFARVSVTTVKKSVAELKSAGLLSMRKEGNVGRERNIYTVLSPSKIAASKGTPVAKRPGRKKTRAQSPRRRGRSGRARGQSPHDGDRVATRPLTRLTELDSRTRPIQTNSREPEKSKQGSASGSSPFDSSQNDEWGTSPNQSSDEFETELDPIDPIPSENFHRLASLLTDHNLLGTRNQERDYGALRMLWSLTGDGLPDEREELVRESIEEAVQQMGIEDASGVFACAQWAIQGRVGIREDRGKVQRPRSQPRKRKSA